MTRKRFSLVLAVVFTMTLVLSAFPTVMAAEGAALPAGYVGRWSLDVIDDGSVTDAVSGNFDPIDNAEVAEGRFYGAAALDGTAASNLTVKRNLAGDAGYADGFTASVWVNMSDVTKGGIFTTDTDMGWYWGVSSLSLQVTAEAGLEAVASAWTWGPVGITPDEGSADPSEGWGWNTPAGVLTKGEWHHVTLTYDNAGRMVIYVDGEYVGGATYTNVPVIEPSTLTFGMGYYGHDSWLDGAMDEIVVYNRALTAEEVSAVYGFAPAPDVEEAAPIGEKAYHVDAANGSDSNDGLTKETAFKTIQKAADVALSGETVTIYEGVYPETVRPAYSGLATHPITYRAAEGESVVISGADIVTGAWEKVEGGNTAGAEYDASGSNNLWKAPAVLPVGNYRNQVFVEYDGSFDEVLSARYPNATPDTNPYFEPNWIEYWFSGIGRFEADGVELDDIGGSYGGHGTWGIDGYAYGRMLVKPGNLTQTETDAWAGASIIGFDNRLWQVSGAEITASTPEKASYGAEPVAEDYASNTAYTEAVHNWAQNGSWLTLTNLNFYELGPHGYEPGFFNFYIQNAFAALDNEDEWWYDGENETLWLQLPEGEDANKLDVYFKARQTGLDLSSRRNIIIEGIDLLGCGLSMENAENCVVDSMDALYVASVLSPGSDTETSGIYISGKYNTLINSTVAHSPGQLVDVSGIGHKIVNNKLHDAITGPVLYRFLLNVNGRDHLIKNNEIYNARGAVVGGSYYASEISYNRMHGANYHSTDSGIMYHAYGDYGNSQIHHNMFYNSYQMFSNGVYFDLGTKNALVFNNVFWNIPWAAVYTNAGSEFISAVGNTTYDTGWSIDGNTGEKYLRGNPEIYTNTPTDAYMGVFANNITDQRGVGKDNINAGAVVRDSNYARSDVAETDTFTGQDDLDFTLAAGSGAIGYGEVIEGLYDAGTVDAGAYQYGEEAWQAGVLDRKVTAAEVSAGPQLIANELQNLLFNSGFEWNRTGLRGGGLNGWKTVGTAAVVQAGSSADWAASREQHAIKLTDLWSGVEQTITGLEPGETYALRGHARMGTPGGEADDQQVEIGVKVGDEVISGTLSERKWDRVFLLFTADDSGTATIYATKMTEGSIALVDDFSVVKSRFAEPPPPLVDEFPFYESPVALLDDMLFERAGWTANDGTLERDEATGLTLEAVEGSAAAAFFTDERYGDKDFYIMLGEDEDLDNLDLTIILRAAADNRVGNRYEIVIKGDKVELVRYYGGTPTPLGEWDFKAASRLLKAKTELVLGETAYGSVFVTLKCGDDEIFSTDDTTNLNVSTPGYFGIATDSSVSLARLTEFVEIATLLEDRDNWTFGGTFEWSDDGTRATLMPPEPAGSVAGAGYTGRMFGDAEFAFGYNSDLDLTSYPYINLRVGSAEQLVIANWWQVDRGYNIVFKSNQIELQSWGSPGHSGILKLDDNKGFVSPLRDTVLKASAVNTDYGVWMRLKVGDVLVSNYMDEANLNTEPGYFGFTATHVPQSGNIFVPNENTFNPQPSDIGHVDTYTKSITRGEVIELVYAMAGRPTHSGVNVFSDVSETDSFYNAVIWGTDSGIIIGVGEGLYDPASAMTYEEAAVIVSRYAQLAGLDITPSEELLSLIFSDWAEEHVALVSGAGVLVRGVENLTKTALRAEIVAMFNEFSKLLDE